ncbi:MAG: phospholipase effector Tle1 domain-containing protein [Cupriavidus necator]
MTVVKWPDMMPEGGRLAQSKDAWAWGQGTVTDPLCECPQTIHINLFFDGTNNNDDEDNEEWRDSKFKTHTNIARLFRVAKDKPDAGIFKAYIAGVGTPFVKLGEADYSQDGKALARGFDQRCVWGMIRVLNAVHYAITRDKTRPLIREEEAKAVCDAVARGNVSKLMDKIRILGITHSNRFDDGPQSRMIKKIWINVFGFSRGAASARVFVSKLIKEWAPGGRISDQTGRRALPYEVNFLGLFDTVASVGLPDSTRATVDLDMFDGHFHFARGGALNIPKEVRSCAHFYSIHEQRMSFPLDTIRIDESYAQTLRRWEVGYPGVHSDVGGGYAPNEQGKARDGDSSKLSQIPLHDMYIAALKRGVPLMLEEEIRNSTALSEDFAIHPATVAAFNDWRRTLFNVSSVEEALRFGMGQLLSWRTLRAQIGTGQYVTERTFFQAAPDDAKTPRKITLGVQEAERDDPECQRLKAEIARLERERSEARNPDDFLASHRQILELSEEIEANRALLQRRREVLYGQQAGKTAPARPGEGADETVTNDKSDLCEGAEQMRLLLGYLYPDQLARWQVDRQEFTWHPADNQPQRAPVLSVRHEQPNADTPRVTLAGSGFLFHSARTTIVQSWNPDDDVLAAPMAGVVSFLKQHTSPEAVARLDKVAIALYDDYVHDSRIWFRIPFFNEYAPGGYGWPRVIFTGRDQRRPYLALAPATNLPAANEGLAVA